MQEHADQHLYSLLRDLATAMIGKQLSNLLGAPKCSGRICRRSQKANQLSKAVDLEIVRDQWMDSIAVFPGA